MDTVYKSCITDHKEGISLLLESRKCSIHDTIANLETHTPPTIHYLYFSFKLEATAHHMRWFPLKNSYCTEQHLQVISILHKCNRMLFMDGSSGHCFGKYP